MDSVGNTSEILYDAVEVRLLDDDTSHATLGEAPAHGVEISRAAGSGNRLDVHTMILGVGVDDGKSLRVDSLRDEDSVSLLGCIIGEEHSLGCRCRAVVHRGVGDIHACQLGHHRLVLEDIVECAL